MLNRNGDLGTPILFLDSEEQLFTTEYVMLAMRHPLPPDVQSLTFSIGYSVLCWNCLCIMRTWPVFPATPSSSLPAEQAHYFVVDWIC